MSLPMHLAHGQTNWLSAPWSDEWQHHYKRISPNHSYCCHMGEAMVFSAYSISFRQHAVVGKNDAQPTFLL